MLGPEIVSQLERSNIVAEIMTAVAKLEAGMRFEGQADSGHSVLLDVEAGMPVHQQQAPPAQVALVVDASLTTSSTDRSC